MISSWEFKFLHGERDFASVSILSCLTQDLIRVIDDYLWDLKFQRVENIALIEHVFTHFDDGHGGRRVAREDRVVDWGSSTMSREERRVDVDGTVGKGSDDRGWDLKPE